MNNEQIIAKLRADKAQYVQERDAYRSLAMDVRGSIKKRSEYADRAMAAQRKIDKIDGWLAKPETYEEANVCKGEVTVPTMGVATVMEPTMAMRYITRTVPKRYNAELVGTETVLQQEWKETMLGCGGTKIGMKKVWTDVPTVDET